MQKKYFECDEVGDEHRNKDLFESVIRSVVLDNIAYFVRYVILDLFPES